MRAIVAGSSIMNFPGLFADRIMTDKIHRISLSFLVYKLTKQLGGTATNISYTLKLLDVEPIMVATAGKDFSELGRFLRKHKISTEHISIHRNVSTSTYFVITDKEDNQIGSFYVGAQKYAAKISLQKLGVINADDFVVIAPTDPAAMKNYVRECKNLNLPYFYDPAFQIATFSPSELREGIEGAKILIGNDYEIALIEDRLGISHEELVVMVPVLVTTLGSKGATVETRTDSIYIKPAKTKSVIDPTGAGDAFRAGFIAGYLRGYDLQICGQMGSVAAVYTVEKYGTVTHRFSKKDFLERYKENFASEIKL
ncbi:carbohydrate kinase family protein [Candidatus Gottesmanbacteria bacterium]|nr:carbohydrate kinase family protein [Candidatus Gottesmanbacteria bacterium]